jgi:hypothetical protein
MGGLHAEQANSVSGSLGAVRVSEKGTTPTGRTIETTCSSGAGAGR